VAARRSDRLPRLPFPYDAAIYVISVAAELAGMHPQTLRQYDRLGLVSPGRAEGGGRRYSLRDVAQLREVHRLSQDEGVNLAGIKRILELEDEVESLQQRVVDLVTELSEVRIEAAGAHTAARRRPAVVDASGSVVWRAERAR
jgi:MerR family transcriptional regulator/heat shock protein HspR